MVARERREDVELYNVPSLDDAVTRVKEYKILIKSGKQHVLNLTHQQGFILHKSRELRRFSHIIEELGISTCTITFKSCLYKLHD